MTSIQSEQCNKPYFNESDSLKRTQKSGTPFRRKKEEKRKEKKSHLGEANVQTGQNSLFAFVSECDN